MIEKPWSLMTLDEKQEYAAALPPRTIRYNWLRLLVVIPVMLVFTFVRLVGLVPAMIHGLIQDVGDSVMGWAIYINTRWPSSPSLPPTAPVVIDSKPTSYH